MADPSQAAAAGLGRPPAGPKPGRNKSFRKAREASEEAYYLDLSMEDVQKYFSPDTWRKMNSMNLHSVPASSVQKYFDPVAWEKLQRLGCLRGRPSTTSTTSTSSSGSSSTSAPSSPQPTMAAAKSCFSPRSWEALTRLNVVPVERSPRARGPREGAIDGEDDEDEDDDVLEHGMDEDGCDDNEYSDAASLSSAVHLDGLDGGLRETAPRPAVAEQLRNYFSQDQWRKLEERGVLERALRRLGKETSV